MDEAEPRIDEECRRRFEAHRLGGGREPLGAFLPERDSDRYADTLEEFVLIELEFRWKAWDGGEDRVPTVRALAAEHPELGEDALVRIREEAAHMRRRYGGRGPVETGKRFGRYVLGERVGRGASAEVWRARDEQLQRDVALKLAREESVGDPQAMARLVREAQSTAQLRHPAIVSVHEVATRNGQPFIVSDFIEGPTLAREIARREFPPEEAAAVVARLADALDYAHACGVVHRDVKPGNVMLPRPGSPVLTDFGLAQLARAEAQLTREGDVLGTPAYMAPEQARGDLAAIDPRTDVYALGAVLYELLTGQPPFRGASAASVLYAVLHRDAETPSAVRPTIPPDLETVCSKALSRDPRDRYPSARDLADDLRRFLAREPVLARPPGPVRRLVLWTRRNPALAATLFASIVVVAVVTGVAFHRVLTERDRARIERDRSRANLYRALVGEADAVLAAQETDWYERARESVRQAAMLDVEGRDVLALRGLAARCEAIAAPSFSLTTTLPPHGDSVRALVPLPRDGMLAGIAGPGRVWVRSLMDGRVVATATFADEELRDVAVWDDGRALLVVGDSGVVRVLDATDLTVRSQVDVGREIWSCGAHGRTGYAGLDDGRVLVLREDASLAVVREVEAHEGGVLALDVLDDGTRFATSGEDDRVVQWDASTLAETARYELMNAARTLAYGPQGRPLAWASIENLSFCVARGETAFEQFPAPHLAGVRDVAVASGGRILTSSRDGALFAWTPLGERLAVADARAGAIVAIATTGEDGCVAAYEDGRLRHWRLDESGLRAYLASEHSAVFLPGTKRVYTGARIVSLDVGPERIEARGELLAESLRPPSQVWGTAVSPDGSVLAAASHFGGVLLLEGEGAVLRDMRVGEGPCWVAAFSPDGRTLAVGDGSDVHLIDPRNGARGPRLAGHERLVVGLAFHPAGRVVATAAFDGTVRLWDVNDGALLATYAVLRSPPHGIAFDPDAARLAVALGDGSIALFDTTAREFASRAHGQVPAQFVEGHAGTVWDAAWSRDGALFASCDDRGETILRDGRTLAPLVTLRPDLTRARCVAFSDDRAVLLTTAYASQGVAWNLPALRARFAELGLDW